jgi:hemerythrin
MGRDERIARNGSVRARSSALDAVVRTRSATEDRAGREFDAEYAHLEAWLGTLRAMPECQGVVAAGDHGSASATCSEATRSYCSDRLRSLGTDMLDFMSEHFARENTLMRRGNGIRGLRELFELHAEDHGSIMGALVGALELPTPCAQKRALGGLLDTRMRRHLLTHDASLREQLPRLCHEPVLNLLRA